jgi:hypothetical protein
MVSNFPRRASPLKQHWSWKAAEAKGAANADRPVDLVRMRSRKLRN